MTNLSEQLVFSKEEDQKKFKELPEDEKQELIKHQQGEAVTLKKLLESGDAESYEHAQELLEKSQKSLDSYVACVTEGDVFSFSIAEAKKNVDQITALDHLKEADRYSKMMGRFYEGDLLKIVGSRFDEVAAKSAIFKDMSIRELVQFRNEYHFMLFSAAETSQTILSQLKSLAAKTDFDDLRLLIKDSGGDDGGVGKIFKQAYITQLPESLKTINSLKELEILLKNSPHECERAITGKIIEIENTQKSPDKNVIKILKRLRSGELNETEEEQLLKKAAELKLNFEFKKNRYNSNLEFERKVLDVERIPADNNHFLVLVEDEGDRNVYKDNRSSKSLGLFIMDKELNISTREEGGENSFLETKEAMRTNSPLANIVLHESQANFQWGNYRTQTQSKKLLKTEFDENGVFEVSTGETKKYKYEFISVADKDVGGVEDEDRSKEGEPESKYFYFDKIGDNLIFESDAKITSVEELDESNPDLIARKFKIEK